PPRSPGAGRSPRRQRDARRRGPPRPATIQGVGRLWRGDRGICQFRYIGARDDNEGHHPLREKWGSNRAREALMATGQLEIEGRIHVLLSVQRALLGEVPPALRGVTVGWDASSINIVCYFDGEISEEDQASMSCVETEVIADSFPEYDVRLECVRR